jgi:hypothetical protein
MCVCVRFHKYAGQTQKKFFESTRKKSELGRERDLILSFRLLSNFQLSPHQQFRKRRENAVEFMHSDSGDHNLAEWRRIVSLTYALMLEITLSSEISFLAPTDCLNLLRSTLLRRCP